MSETLGHLQGDRRIRDSRRCVRALGVLYNTLTAGATYLDRHAPRGFIFNEALGDDYIDTVVLLKLEFEGANVKSILMEYGHEFIIQIFCLGGASFRAIC